MLKTASQARNANSMYQTLYQSNPYSTKNDKMRLLFEQTFWLLTCLKLNLLVSCIIINANLWLLTLILSFLNFLYNCNVFSLRFFNFGLALVINHLMPLEYVFFAVWYKCEEGIIVSMLLLILFGFCPFGWTAVRAFSFRNEVWTN